MRRAAFVSLGLTLAVSASMSARQRERATQVVRGGIDLVQVDVSVLDKNRRPVRGLEASDFTLLEDGKPRPVAAFTVVDLPARGPAPKVGWMRDVPSDVATNDIADEGRLVVILMDRTIPFGLPAQSARGVARAAIEQLGPADLAAVVYTGSGTPQDFTSDRGRLLLAIGGNTAAGLSQDVREAWDVQTARQEAELWNEDDAKHGVPRMLPRDNSGECYCGLCVLDSIKNVADAVRDTQGRKKSLLFIGGDLITDSMDPRCQDAVIDAREAMFKSIDLANLTVHAFDANGLESNVVAASSQGVDVNAPINARPGMPAGPPPILSVNRSQQLLLRQGHLAVLPDRTGGRTVLNTNNPEGRVPDVFRESESYYLLGFEPAATDGREHTISVRANRRDVTVRSRRAYVADKPSRFASVEPADRAREAIAAPIAARNGITLSASAMIVAAPVTHNPTLIVALHALHEASPEPAASGPEPVDVVTSVFTLDGRPVGTFNQTLSVTPRAETSGTGMAYDVLQRMVAKPGRYELRIAVDNSTRRQSGTVYAFVDVPALAKVPFAWSAIGISAPATTPATVDGLTEIVPALPIARRDFRRQERVTAFISAYHTSGALPAPMEIRARITDQQDRQRLDQKAAFTASDFDASHTANYTLDLPLSTLEPGSYLLTMEATAAREKTTRYVRFTVR